MGWERGCNLKGPFSKLGQETGSKKPIIKKGLLRNKDASAMKKGKVVSEVSDVQPRDSAVNEVKFGSKKFWTTLFPPSFDRRQGVRRQSKPITYEKPSSNCEAPPKKGAFEAGSQLE